MKSIVHTDGSEVIISRKSINFSKDQFCLCKQSRIECLVMWIVCKSIRLKVSTKV